MKLLRLPAVMEKTGLAKSTIYKYVKQGDFPATVPLCGRSVAWIDSEVDEWLSERLANRGRQNIPPQYYPRNNPFLRV